MRSPRTSAETSVYPVTCGNRKDIFCVFVWALVWECMFGGCESGLTQQWTWLQVTALSAPVCGCTASCAHVPSTSCMCLKLYCASLTVFTVQCSLCQSASVWLWQFHASAELYFWLKGLGRPQLHLNPVFYESAHLNSFLFRMYI